MIPLKNKSGSVGTQAFKDIFAGGRVPKFLWTDKGREFWNKYLLVLLEEKGVKLYSTENEEKSSVFERWNRTMKQKMWKYFTASNSTVWVDTLPRLVREYNNTKQSSVKMMSVEVSKRSNEGLVYFRLLGDLKHDERAPKFKVGDKVRLWGV